MEQKGRILIPVTLVQVGEAVTCTYDGLQQLLSSQRFTSDVRESLHFNDRDEEPTQGAEGEGRED